MNNLANGHDTFLAHNCPAAKLWRVVHVDEAFARRYRAKAFPVRENRIRGALEHYVEIDAADPCVRPIRELTQRILAQK